MTDPTYHGSWLAVSLWETIRKKKSLKTAAHVRYVGCIGGVKAGVTVLRLHRCVI